MHADRLFKYNHNNFRAGYIGSYFGGVLPVIKDYYGEYWIYLAEETYNKKLLAAIFGGRFEKQDHTILDTAYREFQEESLGIFADQISSKTLQQENTMFLSLSLLNLTRVGIFIPVINNNSVKHDCDPYANKYAKLRYKNNKKLKSVQQEAVNIYKIKLKDLLGFLNQDKKFLAVNAINSQCKVVKNIKFRWSSLLLLNSPEIKRVFNLIVTNKI